jgi:hypothetical protein
VDLGSTAVLSNPHCSTPPLVVLNKDNASNFTITAKDTDGCTSVASFNPDSSDQQYGTSVTDAGTCGLDPSTDISFLPVMFWFFHVAANGTQQARAIICRPQIQLFEVEARIDLGNNAVIMLSELKNFTASNNITGSPLNGHAYNG